MTHGQVDGGLHRCGRQRYDARSDDGAARHW